MRQNKRFILALFAGCLVIALGVWLSSGTLAPYAATLEKPRIDKPCNYLLNTDHVHFEAAFLMLDGAPRERWDFSIYLRRILYPLLAYPFMKAFGFLAGGVIASVIIQLAAFVTLVLYFRRKLGEAAAYVAMTLVAFYPGICYWGGLPYNHVMIAPASLLGVLLLWEMERAEMIRRAGVCALLLGVLMLGYDLMPLFGPPMLAILVFRRKLVHAAVAAAALVTPTLLTNALLSAIYDLPFRNKNTQAYYDILQAYFHPTNPSHWAHLVSNAPGDFVRAFFFSNFWFLPAMFLAVVIVNRLTIKLKTLAAERWLLLTTLALFAFINLAPPTPGWQFRGSGMARIYQPAFAAMIVFLVRWFAMMWDVRHAWLRPMAAALAVTSLSNAVVIFGPVIRVPLADRVYLSFYRHAQTLALSKNLDTFGRRPLGFCDTSITIESPLSNRELKLLKEKKQRDKAKKLKKAAPPKKKKKKPALTQPTTTAIIS